MQSVKRQTVSTVTETEETLDQLPGWARKRMLKPITMRALVEWTYCEQAMGFEYGGGPEALAGSGADSTLKACRMLGGGLVGDGVSANARNGSVMTGRTNADAEVVDRAVGSCLSRREQFEVVNLARARSCPEWNLELQPLRVVPVLRANGRPRMIVCEKSRKPIACRIEMEGYSAKQQEMLLDRAQQLYLQWWDALYAVRETLLQSGELKQWALTGVGAERCPWQQHGEDVAIGC